jgi:DNA replication and repair protein RecF
VPLERVRIENCRCIEAAELELSTQRNYVYGPNGAGKTSLLEALFLLGRGRSFRTRQNKRLIRYGAAALTVYAEARVAGQAHRLGARLDDAGLESRLDGVAGVGVAELARLLPVNVVEPSIHELIEGGPSKRRRFLDWGVFHVEQGFLEAWRRYRRALSQRNAALKQGTGAGVWDGALVEAGAAVDRARRRYFEQLSPVVSRVGESLVGRRIGLRYRPGWPESAGLEEALAGSRERDQAVGATQVGPHRADLVVTIEDRAVRDEASRGQQKLVATALIVAQVQVFADVHGAGGVLLVDDPAAELDARASEGLMTVLEQLPAQLILTGLSAAALRPVQGAPVFHVEQGRVRTVV